MRNWRPTITSIMNSTYVPPFASPSDSKLSTESIIAIVGAVLTVAVPLCGFVFKRFLSKSGKTRDLEQATSVIPHSASQAGSKWSKEAIIAIIGVMVAILVPTCGILFKRLSSRKSFSRATSTDSSSGVHDLGQARPSDIVNRSHHTRRITEVGPHQPSQHRRNGNIDSYSGECQHVKTYICRQLFG
ncbi:hypothetical protein HDK64DRAFT_334498 [Phyllosticta capitalensis]